jgi:GH15 family glucan-1,4-alpha-glucosidase
MCWVAIDRALRLAAQRSFPAPISEWRAVRDEIFGWVHREFWDEDKGAYVMVPGSSVIDAASLMMPFVKFIAPSDPRWHRHLRALEHELVEDALVYRYRQRKIEDGLGGVDGSFTMCSFWYVENLARVGRVDDARLLFEKLASYGNHLGLYSEELGTAGEHLGNFPQGITHLGLISAALALDDALQRKGRTRAP